MVLPVKADKETTHSCCQPPAGVVIGLNLAYYFFHFIAFIVFFSDIKSANQDCGDIDTFRTCSTKFCYRSCNIPEWCSAADPCSGAISFCSTEHADGLDDCGIENGIFMFNTSIAAFSITLFAIVPYLLLMCLEVSCPDEMDDAQEFYDVVFHCTCLLKFGAGICILMANIYMFQAQEGIFSDVTYFLCVASLILKLVNLVPSTYCCLKCVCEDCDEEEHRQPETEIETAGYDFEGSSAPSIDTALPSAPVALNGSDAPPPAYDSHVPVDTRSWDLILHDYGFPDSAIDAFRTGYYDDTSIWGKIRDEELEAMGVVKGLLLKFRKDYPETA